MLRKVVLALALILLAVGVVAVATGAVGAWVCIIWGGIVAAGIVYERFRYKPLHSGAPGPGWVKTNERFVDDETGKTVSVYVEPKTGERTYVQD
jgi:hypothetical protein